MLWWCFVFVGKSSSFLGDICWIWIFRGEIVGISCPVIPATYSQKVQQRKQSGVCDIYIGKWLTVWIGGPTWRCWFYYSLKLFCRFHVL